ncbi:hypothetical protein C8T65DRAFT_744396 [Cerioporus squamosus]|nr:hypothetical protein C8T65DRAFT_744396 [Cerioporus squamosus]
MSPLWQIINVDRREANTNIWGQLGAWFFYPHDQLVNYLSIPCLPQEIDVWLAEGKFNLTTRAHLQASPRAHLRHLRLAARLSRHHLLLDHLQAFPLDWKPHILRATKAYYAPWAGGRLIALGDDTPSLDDLPSGLLTDAERKEIEMTEPALTDGPDEHEKNLSSFARESFERVFHIAWRMVRTNFAVHHRHRICDWHIPDEHDQHPASLRRSDVPDAVRRRTARDVPRGHACLVQPLEGEYVRQDGLTSPNYVNLGHALLSRICWSTSTDVGMACDDGYRAQLTKGPWAGDRFCISTLELLPELERGRLWTDVTSEVHALLSHVWNNNEQLWSGHCATWTR